MKRKFIKKKGARCVPILMEINGNKINVNVIPYFGTVFGSDSLVEKNRTFL